MTWRKSAVRVRYRPPLQNIVEHIVCSTFLFIAVVDDNGQRTLSQSERGAQVCASKPGERKMLCIFCLLTNYNLLQVINHILSNSMYETVFRGPLSSTICATFLLSQSECGAQVCASKPGESERDAFKYIPPIATITCCKLNYIFHITRDNLSRSVIVHQLHQSYKPTRFELLFIIVYILIFWCKI